MTINTALAFGSAITFNLEYELFASLQDLVKTSDFKHYSFDSITLRVTPLSNKYYRGMFGLTFRPGPQSSTGTLNPVYLSSLDTTLVDISSTQAVEVTVPWLRPLPKTLLGLSTMGEMILWIIDPVATDTAPGVSSAVDLVLEAHFNNFRFHDPQTNATGSAPVIARRSLAPAPGTFFSAQSSSVRSEATKKASQGTISSTLNAVSSIASAASVFPVVGGFASGLSVISSAASSVFDWFGLSMPPNLTTPTPVIQGQPPFMNTLSGVVNADVFAASQVPFVSTDPHLLASNSDACNLQSIATRSSLIQQFQIPANKTGAGLLGTIPVTPVAGWRHVDTFIPSNPCYVANLYRTWRGEIAYKFVISASPMTRCRLIITYTLDKQTTFNQKERFMYVEVCGTTVVDGIIPWMSREPYQPVPALHHTNILGANGYIQIWQDTSLVSDTPGVSPRPLSLTVFHSATKNTQFVDPGSIRGFVLGVSQGFLGLDNSSSLSGILADDSFMSSRELLHRPTIRQTLGLLPTFLNPNSLLPQDHQVWYLIRRWMYYRGSITVHMIMSTNPTSTVALSRASKGTVTIATSDMIVYWTGSERKVMSILLPYTDIDGYTDTLAYDYPSIYIDTVIGPTPTITWWLSFNDDLSLGVDKGPVRVTVPNP